MAPIFGPTLMLGALIGVHSEDTQTQKAKAYERQSKQPFETKRDQVLEPPPWNEMKSIVIEQFIQILAPRQ